MGKNDENLFRQKNCQSRSNSMLESIQYNSTWIRLRLRKLFRNYFGNIDKLVLLGTEYWTSCSSVASFGGEFYFYLCLVKRICMASWSVLFLKWSKHWIHSSFQGVGQNFVHAASFEKSAFIYCSDVSCRIFRFYM